MDDRELLDETAEGVELDSMSQFFGTAKDVVDRYTHCVLCGANLHFSHQTDFSRNITQETAKCPECGVRVRSVMHRLQ
jgi:DNA-directed RNA polymerase subunit RPC12/RpoP